MRGDRGMFKLNMLPYNKQLKIRARELRNNMTDAERLLWSKLRSKKFNVQFYRQKIIGNYIVDFYCHPPRLVIELDGFYHEGKWENDSARDDYLKYLGLKVLRFNNVVVFNDIDNVLQQVWVEVEPYIQKNPPNPLYKRGK